MTEKNSKIYIAGHKGMVGSSIWRALKGKGYSFLIGRTRDELDLLDQQAVRDFFREESPEVVINAAAKVGGIVANRDNPYSFIMENLQIQNNLIHEAVRSETKKFIFLGSSCIYPKHGEQPLKEKSLLTGPLESTNEWYAIAKIAGIKVCEAARKQYGFDCVCLMPTNLYGFYDNFDLESSHVMPAMIRKFHEAKENNHANVNLWGTGEPMREFMFVDDLADATVYCLEKKLSEFLYNVGTGKDIEIKTLAKLVQNIVGHRGRIVWDHSKPNGTPRKLLDISKLSNEGWQHSTELREGIAKTYQWFLNNFEF